MQGLEKGNGARLWCRVRRCPETSPMRPAGWLGMLISILRTNPEN